MMFYLHLYKEFNIKFKNMHIFLSLPTIFYNFIFKKKVKLYLYPEACPNKERCIYECVLLNDY